MTTTAPLSTPPSARPWPRDGVFKTFGPDGRARVAGSIWFVRSATTEGAYWFVQFHRTADLGPWWTCSCPAGHARPMMGGKHAGPCRHVKAVVVAEQADGYAPRPTAPANVSALVD